jgi:NAD(P)-dependent dehydrogenase (short-subunit alcohol dehydrogenase family)
MSFKGKNIIVTGATGDLGTAITQRLTSQGANVLAVGSRAGGSRALWPHAQVLAFLRPSSPT